MLKCVSATTSPSTYESCPLVGIGGRDDGVGAGMGVGGVGGAGAGGAGGGDSELKQRVRAQMAGMMRDRGDDGEEF